VRVGGLSGEGANLRALTLPAPKEIAVAVTVSQRQSGSHWSLGKMPVGQRLQSGSRRDRINGWIWGEPSARWDGGIVAYEVRSQV
jgi:hypothetical protein